MTNDIHFSIQNIDNNNLRYIAYSSHSPQDLYDNINIIVTGGYDNYDKFQFITPNYTDEELSNKSYNNLIDNINDITSTNNLDKNTSILTPYEEFYSSMGVNINTGIPSIFENIKNVFTTVEGTPISITIPFTNTNIVIDSNLANNYPVVIKNFLSMFWYGMVGLFIIFNIYNIIIKIQSAEISKDKSSKIYKDLL